MPVAPPDKGTLDYKKLVISLKSQGLRVRDIARAVKSSDRDVSKVLQEEGLLHKRRRGDLAPFARKISPEQETQLVGAYLAGESLSSLGRTYGCNPVTISNTLERLGIDRRKSGGSSPYNEKTARQVKRLWDSGQTQGQIAETLEMGVVSVGRLLRSLGTVTTKASGKRHGLWKGGRSVTESGYMLVHVSWDHPMASMRNQTGYVLEHRLKMAEHLGRPLRKTETVHHIDGDRTNNALENLQLRQGKHGTGVRLRCACCGSEDLEPVELN